MTKNEVLATAVLQDGAPFVTDVRFTHTPTTAIPTANDLNAALDHIGAEITVDAVSEDGMDAMGATLSFGIAHQLEITAHVDSAAGQIVAGQITSWLSTAFGAMSANFSLHAISPGQIFSLTPDASDTGIAGLLKKILPDPGVTGTLSLVSLAVIAVVAFVLFSNLKKAAG